jgi:restriction system protein
VAVPTFQEVMLPLLKLAADGAEHTFSTAVNQLATEFGLSEADQEELLPSGNQPRFANRVGWARTYLKAAGLLEMPARGVFKITNEGANVLAENPPAITMKFLERFPGYIEFRTPKGRDSGTPDELDDQATPEEQLQAGYDAIRETLASELLDRIKKASPKFFEHLVVDLLVQMGYGGSRENAGRAVGQTGDGGVDGLINEDRLGLDVVYIQAKRWQGTVGRPEIQKFTGSLEGLRARNGVFITTSTFSPDACDYVQKIEKRVVLIDGRQLADLMIDTGVGVTPIAVLRIQKVDEDFFDDTVARVTSAVEETEKAGV